MIILHLNLILFAFDDHTRPHWAKSWEYVPNITQYLHEQLGERAKKFEAVRAKYDPNGIFFDNESLKQVIYGTK